MLMSSCYDSMRIFSLQTCMLYVICYDPTPDEGCLISKQNTTLIKKSRNSFRKFKIQFYSSKVILSPSKYSPSTATHSCQRLIQLSKHFWNSVVSIAIRAVFDFSITSFRLLKRVPRNDFLTRSNRKKSVSQHFQGFHTIESIFNTKFNTNSLLQIQFHF